MKKIDHVLLFVAICLLTACSTTIKSDDRDTSTTHFGRWQMKISGTPKIIGVGSYTLRCWNMATITTLTIVDGHTSASLFGSFLSGFVDAQGRFSSASASSGDRFTLNGKLDAEKGTGSGRLTRARGFHGGQGCYSKVEFVRDKKS